MLDDLDDVPWGELTHAYGEATDVPAQLRALASEDAELRAHALHELYGNVFHQGTRYTASAHVVPFLLEMLRAPEQQEKHELLWLICSLVAGYFNVQEAPVWHDGEAVMEFGHRSPVDELEVSEEEREYLDALRDVYAAAWAGFDVYVEMLDHALPEVRSTSAMVLACFARHADRVAPVLERRLDREEDPSVRACLAFALGWMGGWARLRALVGEDPSPLVRLYAAMALVPEHVDEDVLETLLTGFGAQIEVDDLYCTGGDLDADIAATMDRLTPERIRPALPRLYEALSQAKMFDTISIVRAIFHGTFPAPTGERGRVEPGDLDADQRRALQVMVDTDDVWSVGNLHATFHAYGLPWDRAKLRAILEGTV